MVCLMTESGAAPIEILLVEDDPGDVLITREAFAEHKLRNRLSVLADGVEALAYLRGEGRYVDRALPDLILLDLNLPRMDGRRLLEILRADPTLARIPVVVLTASPAEEDFLRGFRLGVDAYVDKPVDFARLVEVVQRIDAFYLSVDRVPSRR